MAEREVLTAKEAAAVYVWAVGDGQREPPADPAEMELVGKGRDGSPPTRAELLARMSEWKAEEDALLQLWDGVGGG